MASPYGYKWRTKLRPETLARDCYECVRCGVGDRPKGCKRSALEIAHLDRTKTNNDPDNRATLCNTCHKRHDYPTWAPAYRAYLRRVYEEKVDRLDADRAILQLLLREAS